MLVFFKRILILFFLVGVVGYTYDNFINIFREFHFTTKDGAFQDIVIPSKGGHIDVVKIKFTAWKETHNNDTIKLYRTHKKNYLKYWRWSEYAHSPLYQEFDYINAEYK